MAGEYVVTAGYNIGFQYQQVRLMVCAGSRNQAVMLLSIPTGAIDGTYLE